MICQYIDSRMKEEFGAWPVCKVLTGAGVKIAPKHVTHARRSRPPSARGLRDEILKAEMSRVHKNQLPRCWGPARCTRYGADPRPPSVTVPVTWPAAPSNASWQTWAYAASDAPGPRAPRAAHRESNARPTSSEGISTRSGRTSCRSPTFPRKREVPLLRAYVLRVGLRRLRHRCLLAANRGLADLHRPVHRPGPGRPSDGRLAAETSRS